MADRHAGRGQPIEIRHRHIPPAMDAAIRPAEIVGEEDDDVGRVRGFRWLGSEEHLAAWFNNKSSQEQTK